MQVVLLAAGMGLRLGPLTRATPKCMVPVNGKPLVDYALERLLANKRVSEVLVVGGFEFSSLRDHIKGKYAPFGERVRLLQNKNFTKANLFSLAEALPWLEESFLVCNVDHIYQEDTWRFILQERAEVSVFCDFLRVFQPDEMKVLLDQEKHLLEMSKTLVDFHGAYVGLTYVPKGKLKFYREAFAVTQDRFGDSAVVENVLPILRELGPLTHVIPFDKHEWYEVDTREDLARAEEGLHSLVEEAKSNWVE